MLVGIGQFAQKPVNGCLRFYGELNRQFTVLGNVARLLSGMPRRQWQVKIAPEGAAYFIQAVLIVPIDGLGSVTILSHNGCA